MVVFEGQGEAGWGRVAAKRVGVEEGERRLGGIAVKGQERHAGRLLQCIITSLWVYY